MKILPNVWWHVFYGSQCTFTHFCVPFRNHSEKKTEVYM